MNNKKNILFTMINMLRETNIEQPECLGGIEDIAKFSQDQNLLYALDILKIQVAFPNNKTLEIKQLSDNIEHKLKDTVYYQDKMIKELKPILLQFQEENIDYIISKGYSYQYHFNWIRPYGDIDLWIAERNQVVRAHNFLIKNGFSCSINEQDLDENEALEYLDSLIVRSTHLLSYEKGNLFIEIHQPAGDPFDYQKIIRDKVSDGIFSFPNKLDMLMITCEHAWQHNYKNFYNLTWISPDKLRHYYDVYRTYLEVIKEYTFEQIISRSKELHALGIFVYIMKYTGSFFGNFTEGIFKLVSESGYQYLQMFPDRDYNPVEYFLFPKEKARDLLSKQIRKNCIAEYRDDLTKTDQYTYAFHSLVKEEDDYWPCHIYSDLAFDLKSVDVRFGVNWNEQCLKLHLLLDFKETRLCVIGKKQKQLALYLSMLLATADGRTNQIRAEFFEEGRAEAYIYRKDVPPKLCMNAEVTYKKINNSYYIEFQLAWNVIGIEDIMQYLNPLYFDFVAEFVPEGPEEITQFISWAGGCGNSMWPDYFMRTLAELKLQKEPSCK